jgi:peptide/nickel transport system substrate-binding protein
MTTGQIESWSDCNWSDAEYDELFLEQQTTIDLQERIDIVRRMQQIVYDESPYIPLVYPLDLENANTGKWTGWVRAQEKKGAWWYNTQPDSYVAVHPAVVTEEGSSGGSSTGIIIGVVVAAIVVVIAVLLLRRRGGRRELEG